MYRVSTDAPPNDSPVAALDLAGFVGTVSAGVILTHVAEVKVTHLGEGNGC